MGSASASFTSHRTTSAHPCLAATAKGASSPMHMDHKTTMTTGITVVNADLANPTAVAAIYTHNQRKNCVNLRSIIF
eukprot:m.662519 g.662519  ORF g.662519 m.662519 type:complete len:77 (-) comp22741_c0_seq12:248-478(-)